MTRQRPITLHPPAAAVRKSFCDPAHGGFQRKKRLFFPGVGLARRAEHDVSIPDQKRRGRAYCASRRYELVET